jgi:cell division protein FtsL
MTQGELKQKIKTLATQIQQSRKKVEDASVEWDELTKFPELKKVIVDLLTEDFNSFLSSIDWVAPKPTTFRINLKNNQSFYLIYGTRSWIAQIEGKKYYLLNLQEEEHACEAISRILRIALKKDPSENNDGFGGFDEEPPSDSSTEPSTEDTPEEKPE